MNNVKTCRVDWLIRACFPSIFDTALASNLRLVLHVVLPFGSTDSSCQDGAPPVVWWVAPAVRLVLCGSLPASSVFQSHNQLFNIHAVNQSFNFNTVVKSCCMVFLLFSSSVSWFKWSTTALISLLIWAVRRSRDDSKERKAWYCQASSLSRVDTSWLRSFWRSRRNPSIWLRFLSSSLIHKRLNNKVNQIAINHNE